MIGLEDEIGFEDCFVWFSVIFSPLFDDRLLNWCSLQTVCVQNADFQIVYFLSHNYVSYSYSENLHIISKQFDPQAPDVKNTSISTEIFRGTIMITTVQGIIVLIVIHSTFPPLYPIIKLWHHKTIFSYCRTTGFEWDSLRWSTKLY